MKIEVIKPEEQIVENEYPCFKINPNTGTLVLFKAPHIGTVIQSNNGHNTGDHEIFTHENSSPYPAELK